jgi:REP element-mobilizing transposase RayT
MLRVASVFFIDIAAFCVMSNHYHLLLHVRRDDAISASAIDIVRRAHQVVSGNEITHKYANRQTIEPHEREQVDIFVDRWRKCLFEISWFMKILNEGIARRANKEDECTGHFWEARYKSQPLLDEKSILSCMAYIDLNPVRAAIADTPEQSDHTSIQLRIDQWKNKKTAEEPEQPVEESQPPALMPLIGNSHHNMPQGLAFNLIDYIELVDWTGRIIRQDKRGAITDDLPPILQRLDFTPEQWVVLTTRFEHRFKGLVGTIESLKAMCANFGLKRTVNLSSSKLLLQ